MAEIVSNSDPDDPRPWFDANLRTDLRAEIREVSGLSAADWTDAADEDEEALVEDSAHDLVISADHREEVHVLLITTDGDIEFVPRSEQPATCYAHLAWYDPETAEIEVLQFKEP